MAAWLDLLGDPRVIVTLSVMAHVSAAIWYTKRQRTRFQEWVNGRLAPIESVLQRVGEFLTGDVPVLKTTVNDAYSSARVAQEQLETIRRDGMSITLPDMKPEIVAAITEYANGQKSKTHAAVEDAEHALADRAMGEDPQLSMALDLFGVDAETRRKVATVVAYARRLGWLNGGGEGGLSPFADYR